MVPRRPPTLASQVRRWAGLRTGRILHRGYKGLKQGDPLTARNAGDLVLNCPGGIALTYSCRAETCRVNACTDSAPPGVTIHRAGLLRGFADGLTALFMREPKEPVIAAARAGGNPSDAVVLQREGGVHLGPALTRVLEGRYCFRLSSLPLGGSPPTSVTLDWDRVVDADGVAKAPSLRPGLTRSKRVRPAPATIVDPTRMSARLGTGGARQRLQPPDRGMEPAGRGDCAVGTVGRKPRGRDDRSPCRAGTAGRFRRFSMKQLIGRLAVWQARDVIVVILMAVLMQFLDYRGYFASTDGRAADILLRFNAERSRAPRIVTVSIGDDDYKNLFNDASPLDPLNVMRIVGGIRDAGARIVGVDLLTESPSYRELAEARNELHGGVPVVWAAAPRQPRVVAASFPSWFIGGSDQFFARPGVVLGRDAPAHSLAGGSPQAERWGIPLFPVEEDGAIRRVPRAWQDDATGAPVRTFAEEVARALCENMRPCEHEGDGSSSRMARSCLCRQTISFTRYSIAGRASRPLATARPEAERRSKPMPCLVERSIIGRLPRHRVRPHSGPDPERPRHPGLDSRTSGCRDGATDNPHA